MSLALFVPSACNLKCIYCYEDAGKSQPGELNLEEYKDIIRQAKELGAQTVWTPGSGEPTIWRNIRKFVEFIANEGLTPVIFTNSTVVDAELSKFFYDTDASIVTKLNSFDKKTQNILAGKDWAYDKIQRGLNHLLDAGFHGYEQENGVEATRLAVESVICTLNANEIPDILSYARQNQIFPYL